MQLNGYLWNTRRISREGISQSAAGTAKAAKAAIQSREKTISDEVIVEQLGKLSGDTWKTIVAANLRSIVASVRNRRELVSVILAAARFDGRPRIPIGWMKLTFETKTVIGSSPTGCMLQPPLEPIGVCAKDSI